jgi:type IV pilus assembly protein PilA
MLKMKERIAAARNADGGFTLIELAVVILIIGILLALALPSFLGVRSNAQNKEPQVTLRNTLANEKANWQDAQTYAGTAFSLTAQEPGVVYTEVAMGAGASSGPKAVAFYGDASKFIATAFSKAGRCYLLVDDLSAAGQGTNTYWKAGAAPCALPATLAAVPTPAALAGYTIA